AAAAIEPLFIGDEELPAPPLVLEDAPAHLKIVRVTFTHAIYRKTEAPVKSTLLEMEILRQYPDATLTRRECIREGMIVSVTKKFRGEELIVSGTDSEEMTMTWVSDCAVNFKTEVIYTEIATKNRNARPPGVIAIEREKKLEPIVIAWGQHR